MLKVASKTQKAFQYGVWIMHFAFPAKVVNWKQVLLELMMFGLNLVQLMSLKTFTTMENAQMFESFDSCLEYCDNIN